MTRQKSEIDRLIELASDQAPPSPGQDRPPRDSSSARALAVKDPKESRPSMWQALLQLRVLLPYLTRLLPLLEGTLGRAVGGRPEINLDTSHFDQEISGIESAHRDLSQQVQDQTAQLKHLLEQLTWLSAAAERNTRAQEEIAERLQSAARQTRNFLIAITVLLLALIAMTAILLSSVHG